MSETQDRRPLSYEEPPIAFNYVADVVEARAEETPDELALIAINSDASEISRLTFRQLADLAKRAGAVLQRAGVGFGDHVFIQLPRVVDWYAAVLGSIRMGAVPMPSTSQLATKDQAYRIEKAGATAVITDVVGASQIDAIQEPTPSVRFKWIVGDSQPSGWRSWRSEVASEGSDYSPADTSVDDPLILYFTSGTTGMPKMVRHSGRYALAQQSAARDWYQLSPGDVHWTVSDTGWAKAAWGKLFGQWAVGSTVVMWDIKGKPRLDRLVELIGELHVNSFCAPPTLYRGLVQLDLKRHDFSELRHCTSAGEPLNPEVIEKWREATGTIPMDGYGQTETTCLVGNVPETPVRPGSMGRPMPGYTVEVVDDDGRVMPVGEEGHIAVATDPWPMGLFGGYWKDESQNERVFRHGWYYTGDRAYRDEDGYFWYVARDDDIIVSAAYRIGPFEVESAIISHPAVAEVAVVGYPDEERGHIVRAFVVLAEGFAGSDALAAEIQDHVKSVTAPYKYPRKVDFVSELPKTVSGKVRRTELRKLP